MPAVYRIDEELGLVLSVASGVVTDRDLIHHLEALRSDPRLQPCFDQIYDLSNTRELRASAETVRSLARIDVFAPGTRRALVATLDEVYGVARMYATYRLGADEAVCVVRTLDEACAWIGLDPDAGRDLHRATVSGPRAPSSSPDV